MRFDDSLRDREPESDATVIVAARLPEIVEQMLEEEKARRGPVAPQNQCGDERDRGDRKRQRVSRE